MYVDKAHFVEDARQPRTFLGQEAGILLVALPVFQVDFMVGDIPVAADDHFASQRLQCQQVRQEQFHEAELGFLALGTGRTGGAVHGNDGQVAKITAHVAAFGIEFGAAEADMHGVRFHLAVHARAGVTLFLGIVEMAMVAVRVEEFRRHVGQLRLQFLHADEIGCLRAHPVEKAFFGGGTDAVQIGGDNFWHRLRVKRALDGAGGRGTAIVSPLRAD